MNILCLVWTWQLQCDEVSLATRRHPDNGLEQRRRVFTSFLMRNGIRSRRLHFGRANPGQMLMVRPAQ